MNTHSAIIIFPKGLGKAFIDGIPDTCDHDYTGATVFTTASGKVIHWHTFRRWASFTSMARDPLIMEHQEEQGDPVVSAAVTCSKCGKPFNVPI